MRDLPLALVVGIAVTIAALLTFNIVADVVVGTYEGYPTTLLLGTILGGLLGIHRFFRGGDGL